MLCVYPLTASVCSLSSASSCYSSSHCPRPQTPPQSPRKPTTQKMQEATVTCLCPELCVNQLRVCGLLRIAGWRSDEVGRPYHGWYIGCSNGGWWWIGRNLLCVPGLVCRTRVGRFPSGGCGSECPEWRVWSVVLLFDGHCKIGGGPCLNATG
jgi:hypothetical protein